MNSDFWQRVTDITRSHEQLITRANVPDAGYQSGWYTRYQQPVLTAEHVPLSWRYDFNPKTNPHFLERLAVNAAFNPGAIEFEGQICLVARVEGADRKSFFAIAASANGVDNFRFWDYPILLPQTSEPDTNVYDMRLVRHEDGWIYGLFCTERKAKNAPPGDTSTAEAQCGIVRTRDLKNWERLSDLKSASPQQRNVVLHPEFIAGKYAFYTRPQDDFITAGSGGGIGFGLADNITQAHVKQEEIIDARVYHTITEVKNGLGPAPIKTAKGWLQIAHGVRNTAAGLRYVVYAFLSDLKQPNKVLHRPGGYLIAPQAEERVGDVSNVIFCNASVARANGELFIYYASSDTRVHVAKTTVDVLLDYVENTPEDPHYSHLCVEQRIGLIRRNLALGAGVE